ncbi:MAG: response regulator transcription factor [Prolixibacteraceae bacterium]|nr:response regulator transcription factor [Prolixibacteraceae bacterium]
MNVVLIEDEAIALRKLKKIIVEVAPETVFLAELESVFDAKNWFRQNSNLSIDLILSDIQLSDGLSFEIFESLNTHLPIIFTTAYNEYALRAFKLNGIDYLLKPIQKDELQQAFSKFMKTRTRYSNDQLIQLQQLIQQFKQPQKLAPSFISYAKDQLIPFTADTVVYFYTSNQLVYAVTEQREFVLNEILEEIEARLDPNIFFRANRQFIIQKRFIANAELYFNNRLIVHLKQKTPEKIVISREKAASFKEWLVG